MNNDQEEKDHSSPADDSMLKEPLNRRAFIERFGAGAAIAVAATLVLLTTPKAMGNSSN
ncbi:MAG: hypothetical protein HQK55_03895 [Deltaproteobacteria bacterium]|nr:hypothetical protein [Deltaproteobacteria bacterium]